MSVTAFKVGDQVRAKHDHAFEGRIEHVFANRETVRFIFDHAECGSSMLIIPAAWLEIVPRHDVPMKVLFSDDVWGAPNFLNAKHRSWFMDTLRMNLAALGYVPKPDAPKIGDPIPGKCYVVRYRGGTISWCYKVGLSLKEIVGRISMGAEREYTVLNDTAFFVASQFEVICEKDWKPIPAEAYL